MDFVFFCFFLCRKSRQKYGIFLFASHLSYIPMEARQKVLYLCSVIYYKQLIKYDLLWHSIDPAFELMRIFVETSLLEIAKDIVNKINWKVLVLRQKICILNFKNWQPVTADFKVSHQYLLYKDQHQKVGKLLADIFRMFPRNIVIIFPFPILSERDKMIDYTIQT